MLPQAGKVIKSEPWLSGESFSNDWESVEEQHKTVAILKQCVFAARCL